MIALGGATLGASSWELRDPLFSGLTRHTYGTDHVLVTFHLGRDKLEASSS